MSDSKVYLHFVTKRRQARRRIPRNSFFFFGNTFHQFSDSKVFTMCTLRWNGIEFRASLQKKMPLKTYIYSKKPMLNETVLIQ